MKVVFELELKHIDELGDLIKKSKNYREIKKAQAILLSHEKASEESIKRYTDYSKRHAYALKKKYLDKGLESIKGKEKPKKLLLNKQSRNEVIEILTTKTPQDFGYEIDFWSTSILAKLIEEKYKVKY